ncbi:MAG: FtsX-like permease family protein, partial [Bythopirellula sp.]
ELAEAYPDGQVVMLSRIAEARARQRQLSEQHAVILTAVVGIAAAIWVAALAVVNVRQRFVEIGLLRALGYNSISVATLVVGRALLIGLVAAAIGYAVGSWAAIHFGREAFPVTGKKIVMEPAYLYGSLLLAPLLAAAACLIPTALAVVQDPADALRRE